MEYLQKSKLQSRVFSRTLRNRIFSRTLLSYIAVISISFIMIGILSYIYIARLTEKQMEDMYQKAIIDIRTETDNAYMDLCTLSVQISSMKWVEKYIYSDPLKLNYDTMDAIEINNAISELTMFKTTSPLISGIALYFNNKDMVLSSYGRERGARFFKDCIKYEGKSYSYWQDLLNNQHTANIILPRDAKIYGSSCKVLTYIQSFPMQQKNVYASIIYFMDVKNFENQLKSSSVLQEGSVSVLSPNFQPIAGDIPEKADIAALKNHIGEETSEDKLNQMITLGNNKDKFLFYSKSQINGWYYVVIVPKTKSMRAVQKVKIIMLLIGIVYMAIGLLAAFIFTNHNNKPIDHIISLCCSKLYKKSDWQMDFDLLEKSILDMIADKQANEKKIEIYRPIARNAWLVGLVKGEYFIDDKFDEISQALNIKFEYSNFLCMAIKLENREILGNHSVEGLYESLKQINIVVHICDLDTHIKAVIINFNQNVDGYSVADDILSYLEQTGLNYVCAGLSQIFDEAAKIFNGFNEARMALNYSEVHSDHGVIIYEDWKNDKDKLTTLSTEEDVISCLKAGAAQEAFKISLKSINKKILQQKMTLHQVNYLYFSFASIGIKALNELNILDRPSIYPENMFSTDDTEELLCKFYEEICSIVQAKKQKGSDEMINRIIDYIINNLSDNQLCLMTMAEHFKLSSSYLSRYFKSRTSINLTEFINEKRIALSKQYLAEGYSVLETAHMVGYDNDITFRRIFKKMLGITPGRYDGA